MKGREVMEGRGVTDGPKVMEGHGVMDRPEDGGSDASRPSVGLRARRATDIPLRGWLQVLARVKDEIGRDRLTIVSAGIAFYWFLAVFPALGALISLWGLLADPADVQNQLANLRGTLPSAVVELLTGAALRTTQTSDERLGGGFLLSLLLTIWSSNKGMTGLVDGLGIAYDEDERKRNFFAKTGLTLGLTLGAVFFAAVALALVVGLPVVLNFVFLGEAAQVLLEVTRWMLLAVLISSALMILYRVAPPRANAKWSWVLPGAGLSSVLWLLASAGFSLYAANFGSYDKTYGSLAAVVVLLMWLFLSAFIVLLGAELNCEAEKQTAEDSTRGPSRPLGQRGATAADRAIPLER